MGNSTQNTQTNNGVAIAAPIQTTLDTLSKLPVAAQTAFIEYGKQGANMAVLTSTLNKLATDAIAQIPATVTDIALAEAALKNAKATQAQINDLRLEKTRTINGYLANLMTFEKNLAAPIKTLSDAIIEAKKVKEAEANKLRLKDDEIRQYQGYIDRMVAETEALFSTYINTTIEKAYVHALGEANIENKDKEAYIEKVIGQRATVAVFTHKIKPYDWKYNTPAHAMEVDITAKLAAPQTYIDQFKIKILDKFQDYDLAVQDKQTALTRAANEAAEEAKQIEADKNMATTMAAIQSEATPLVVDDGIKALKKSYELDMPESWESSKIIMIAFVNTFQQFKGLRVSPFKISVQQMVDQLSKLKTADNNFNFTGAIWKEVTKL